MAKVTLRVYYLIINTCQADMCGNGPYWAKSVTSDIFFLKNVQKVTAIIAQIGPFTTSTLGIILL